MNRYSLWKYILIVVVLVIGAIYALPNIYGEDPALQVTHSRAGVIEPGFVETVTGTLDKAGIARRGSELGVDFAQTWSCYEGGTIHCGRCGTCVERREAFLLAGLPDPTSYLSTDPLPRKPTKNPAS